MKIHKIEKDVSIPKKRGYKTDSKRFKYPWAEMEVGDSILVRAEAHDNLDLLNRSVNTSVLQYRHKTGKRFKPLLEREENGVRVWRVE